MIVRGKRRISRGCRVIDPPALIHLRKESSVIGKANDSLGERIGQFLEQEALVA